MVGGGAGKRSQARWLRRSGHGSGESSGDQGREVRSQAMEVGQGKGGKLSGDRRGAVQVEGRAETGEGDKEMLPWGSERRGAVHGEGIEGTGEGKK